MAWRYLFARKSHSAVSAIAIVSVCGVAVATMAVVCVLSVLNGFRSLISDRDARLAPQLLVEPASAPLITDADSLSAAIATIPGVTTATPVISTDAVAHRDGRQLPVTLIGVDPAAYARTTGIKRLLTPGSDYLSDDSFTLTAADLSDSADEMEAAAGEYDEAAMLAAAPAAVSAQYPSGENESAENDFVESILSPGVASAMGIPASWNHKNDPGEFTTLTLLMPRRTASTINVAHPAASFMTEETKVCGIFESQQRETDVATIIMPLSAVRALLEYGAQGTAVYVDCRSDPERIKQEIIKRTGGAYMVKNRIEQQSLQMRMVAIEKWITYLLLAFILLIASFNLLSTMSMLIVEKRHDLITLTRIGTPRRMVGSIFKWESVYVSAAGTLAGILLGIALCLAQQRWGLIAMHGDAEMMIIKYYPVKIEATDLLLVLAPSAAITLATALTASRQARRLASLKTTSASTT